MIVGLEDLKAYMSEITLSSGQEVAAEELLRGLQAELELWLNRKLGGVSVTEELISDSTGAVYISAMPVRRIHSVTVVSDGSVPTYSVQPYGILIPTPNTKVRIRYDGGVQDERLAACRVAILRAAAREMTNRHDDTLSVKGLDTRNEGEPGNAFPHGFQPDELMRLSRLRRPVVCR